MIIASPRNTGKSKILDIYMIKEINKIHKRKSIFVNDN
jgi:hypothetical protein